MLTHKTLTWSLEHPSGIQSYIFGTMHVQDARIYSKIEGILPLIESCDVYAAEMHLEEAAQFIPNSADSEDEDDGVAEKYSDHQWDRIVKATKKHFSIDINPYRNMPSIFIIQMITMSIMGKEHAQSLDQFLWNHANHHGKVMKGLETVQEQMDLLGIMSTTERTQDLKTMSRNFSRLKNQIHNLVDRYMDEDLMGLYHQSRMSLGAARKWMVNHRNPIMAERLDQMSSVNSVFAAVGAAHLPGKFGLLRLMKLRGYKVVPLSMAAAEMIDVEVG
jgi:uncharacterized protein YbaP (TraB family)